MLKKYHTITSYTPNLTACVVVVLITTDGSARKLFSYSVTNIIRQFAMDGVRAVVFFLVYWTSQVKAQDQGKQRPLCTILKYAVQNIYVY